MAPDLGSSVVSTIYYLGAIKVGAQDTVRSRVISVADDTGAQIDRYRSGYHQGQH